MGVFPFFSRDVREAVKNYLAGFVRQGGGGVSPNSAKENSPKKQVF